MNHALLVSVLDRVGNLTRVVQRDRQIEGASVGDCGFERLARDVLHYDEKHAFLFFSSGDANDVRMVERREQPWLSEKLAEIEVLLVRNFDRDTLVDPRVLGEVDGSESSAAEGLENPVFAERLASKHHRRGKYIDSVHNLRMHRVYASGATSPSVTLTPSEAHHVTRVLRLRTGDAVLVFDGRGGEWLGKIAPASHDVVVDLVEPRTALPEPAVTVTLAMGLLKGDQMDDVMRDATMLGVAAIQPVHSAHVSLPKGARETRSLERWERVAVASAKQCGRAVVPAILPIAPFADVAQPRANEALVICVEPRREMTTGSVPRPARATVLVGPEGGWSSEELELAIAAGASPLVLGPRTLRAESAPTVALSALWTTWGW